MRIVLSGQPCVAALIFRRDRMNMSKITHIIKAREKRTQKADAASRHEGFQPCSPDMTICGDCQDNRAKNKCPRFKEWVAKRRS
jgi:hypothetical protein